MKASGSVTSLWLVGMSSPRMGIREQIYPDRVPDQTTATSARSTMKSKKQAIGNDRGQRHIEGKYQRRSGTSVTVGVTCLTRSVATVRDARGELGRSAALEVTWTSS